MATAADLPEGSGQRAHLFRDLASAAESGWDFSSRWMATGDSLASTKTTAILPVDLNTLLWRTESVIARLCGMRVKQGDNASGEADKVWAGVPLKLLLCCSGFAYMLGTWDSGVYPHVQVQSLDHFLGTFSGSIH
jgi:hypothetical protein